MSDAIPAIVILGPTASGKTGLAIALATRFQGEIVSCDALQVYKGMDIGTAKVSEAEQGLVPHHMLDVQNPDRDFSAGDYQRMARKVIAGISERGRHPFVVGGTGFYLKALIDGLFQGPPRSEQLRLRMREIIRRRSPAVLHRALLRIDPESAQRISRTDGERIIRAYEVYLLTGKTMKWWQLQPRDAFAGYRWLKLGIALPREQLYDRINRRVDEMFQAGLVEEVRELLREYPREAHSFKAIGYRQAAACLDGALSLADAVEETKKESRHYAKRQLTWFRSEKGIVWLNGQSSTDEIQNEAAQLISAFLKGSHG
jgi:tRNA dimethylallyltransferase